MRFPAVISVVCMVLCAVGFINGIKAEQQRPELVLIHGVAELYDPTPTFVDAPGILKVRTDNNRLWEVSFGGMRLCTEWMDNRDILEGKTRVTVRGEQYESMKLDVCKTGTYIQIVDTTTIEVDKIIALEGTVEYFDPTPTAWDGLGILLVRTQNGDLWDIGFGGGRLPPCTGDVPYQGLIEGETQVTVAGSMKKDGTLDICAEGTFVRKLETAVGTRHPDQAGIIKMNDKTKHRASQMQIFTLNGRLLYSGSRRSVVNDFTLPHGRVWLIREGLSGRMILHLSNAGN